MRKVTKRKGRGVLKLRGDGTLGRKGVCLGEVAGFKVSTHANQGSLSI